MLRFLRLYMTDCFCFWHFNFIITLSDLFILWQACKSSGTTLTPVSDKALQTPGFTSIMLFTSVYFSRYRVYFDCFSSAVLRVRNSIGLELNNSVEKMRIKAFKLLQFQDILDANLSIFFDKPVNFALMSLAKLELISVSSWIRH